MVKHVLLLACVSLSMSTACSDNSESAPAGKVPAETPVGTPTGPSASSTVGSSGGVVVSADGRLEIEVPDGALASDTTITVQPISATAPGAIGGAYRLGPSEVTFAKPVTVRFKLTPTEVMGTAAAFVGVAWQQPSGAWEKPPSSYDAGSGIASTATVHFSDWSALAGLQIMPGTASVKVGKELQLVVRNCRWTEESGDVLCAIGEHCKVHACTQDQVSGKGWEVNGVAGGSGSTGHVVGTAKGATFTAPSKVPSPATVAVSADVGVGDQQGSFTQLVSNVTIVDAVTYQASAKFFDLVGGLYPSGTATLTFTQYEDLPDVASFELSAGQFEVSVNYPDCEPVAKVVFAAGEGQSFGMLVVNKENSAAGKNYFWNAISKTVEVPLTCGSPPVSTLVPLDLSIDGQGSYEDMKSFTGSSVQPMGGSVNFSFTTP